MDGESAAARVLRERQKAQEARACYPCRLRKVKCDKGQPCHMCRRRGHPEICTFPPDRSSLHRRRRRHTDGSERAAVASTQSHSDGHPTTTAAAAPLGNNDSATTILSLHASSPDDGPLVRDVRSMLGLQNTLTAYPFMETNSYEDVASTLVAIAPRQADIVKLYQHYRTQVVPFNPIVLDLERFELDLAVYLKAEVAGELKDPQRLVAGQWSSRKNISFIGLLLSVLASGAHFSDGRKSIDLTFNFAKRSVQALRLANFLFRPSAVDIQTLLVLGNTLQNTGQADAAWTVLGTTVRLAQTLDFQAPYNSLNQSEKAEAQGRLLREKVMYQEAVLCICHDRPPAIYRPEWLAMSRPADEGKLSYSLMMSRLSSISLDFMHRKAFDMWTDKAPADFLQALDDLYAEGASYLLDTAACANLPQLLEHYALRMHVSFTVTFFCRHVIRNATVVTSEDASHDDDDDDDNASPGLRKRARLGLIAVCRAFLDFQALSVVPRRTWSLLHEALSAALLLHAWDATRGEPECRQLQQQVVDVFTSVEASTADDMTESVPFRLLSPQHIRTLLALRGVLNPGQGAEKLAAGTQQQPSEPQQSSQPPPPPPPPLQPHQQEQVQPPPQADSSGPEPAEIASNTFDGIESQFPLMNLFPYLNSQDVELGRLSPLDYLNYYMNGPTSASFDGEVPDFL